MVRVLRDQPAFSRTVLLVKTVGTRTCRSHDVELWFVAKDSALYFLAHKDSDWGKNIKANSKVEVRLGPKVYSGQGRIADELRGEVFEMFREKYGRSQIDYWYGEPKGDIRVVEIKIQDI